MTMLDRMRRHKNWLKWSLGIVVLTFVLLYIPDFVRTAPSGTGAGPQEVVAQINGVRGQADGVARSAAAPADLKAAAAQLSAKADSIRKEVVATKEGGAVTGEERLREHVDQIYGQINSVEDRPTNYEMARIDALDRELKDVEAKWAAFQSADLASFNARLKAANLPPVMSRSSNSIPMTCPGAAAQPSWRGGWSEPTFTGTWGPWKRPARRTEGQKRGHGVKGNYLHGVPRPLLSCSRAKDWPGAFAEATS